MDEYLDKSYWNGLIKMSLSRLFILKVLNEESLHGYEITRRISKMTRGCCAPSEGALYPVLREFEASGYLTCQTQVTEGGRPKKTYSITDKGRRAYIVGIEAWQETAAVLVQSHREIKNILRRKQNEKTCY